MFMNCILLFVDARRQYLSNAVLQAKSATDAEGLSGPARGSLENGLLDLLEGKLAVLQFQIKIKEELEAMASRLEASPSTSESVPGDLREENNLSSSPNFIRTIQERAKELSLDLKSITQLYNDYAVPFELWEVRCPVPQTPSPLCPLSAIIQNSFSISFHQFLFLYCSVPLERILELYMVAERNL